MTNARDVALKGLKRHWPALVLFILALGIRSTSLDPVFYYGDEAEYGIVAGYLADDLLALGYPKLNPVEAWPPTPFVSQPPVVLYMFAFAYKIFGAADITGIWVSIILGAATIPLVYAIGVQMRDRLLGSLAGVFLAVMPFHVNLSRKAMLDAGFVFFLTLALLFLVIWVRHATRLDHDGGSSSSSSSSSSNTGGHDAPRRARTWAILAGVTAGLAVLAKLPGILIIPVVAGTALFVILLDLWARQRADPAATARLKLVGLQIAYGSIPIVALGLLYILLILKVDGWTFLMEKLHFQLGRVDPSLAPAGFAELTTVEKPWHWYFTAERGNVFKLMGTWLVLLGAAGGAVLLVDVVRNPRKDAAAVPVILLGLVFFAFLMYSSRKEWFYLLPLAPVVALMAARIPSGLAPFAANALSRQAIARNRTTGAFAAAGIVLFSGIPAWGAATESLDEVTDVKDKVFGYGTKEAAAYIDANSDPADGQIGTLLGRWSLHYYNGHPTYHFYQQGMLKKLIHMGEITWLVEDKYLNLKHEDALWYKLKNDCGAELATKFEKSWGEVRVWKFEPGRCVNPDEPVYIVPPAGF